jgi:hypothetical protein
MVAQTNKWQTVKSLDFSLDFSRAVLRSIYQVLKLIGFVFNFQGKKHLESEIWKISISSLGFGDNFNLLSLGAICLPLTIDVS